MNINQMLQQTGAVDAISRELGVDPATAEAGATVPAEVPPAARADFERAVKYMRAGNATEAELGFKQIALQYPQFATPLVDLGLLQRKQGQLEQAEASLQAAVANGVVPGSPTFNGIAAATPGLTFICRETVAPPPRSRFDHPLSSRFEEMDCIAVFDDVLIPWENVLRSDGQVLTDRKPDYVTVNNQLPGYGTYYARVRDGVPERSRGQRKGRARGRNGRRARRDGHLALSREVLREGERAQRQHDRKMHEHRERGGRVRQTTRGALAEHHRGEAEQAGRDQNQERDGDLRHHHLDARARLGLLEVRADALFQIARLADVKRPTVGVEHAIDTRPIRQRRDQLACVETRRSGSFLDGLRFGHDRFMRRVG